MSPRSTASKSARSRPSASWDTIAPRAARIAESAAFTFHFPSGGGPWEHPHRPPPGRPYTVGMLPRLSPLWLKAEKPRLHFPARTGRAKAPPRLDEKKFRGVPILHFPRAPRCPLAMPCPAPPMYGPQGWREAGGDIHPGTSSGHECGATAARWRWNGAAVGKRVGAGGVRGREWAGGGSAVHGAALARPRPFARACGHLRAHLQPARPPPQHGPPDSRISPVPPQAAPNRLRACGFPRLFPATPGRAWIDRRGAACRPSRSSAPSPWRLRAACVPQ